MRRIIFSIAVLGIMAGLGAVHTASALEQSRLDELRKKFGVPAVGYAVVYKGKIDAKVSGTRIAGRDIPVTTTDKFRLRSLTKAMVATLVQIYVDRHLLKWDTTLEEVFPDLKEHMHERLRHVTIEMLTAHRSGLVDNPGILMSDLDSREGRKIAVRPLLSAKPRYKPGSFAYSQWNYVILGAVLDSIVDGSFEQSMAKEVFQPLGMKSCGFGLPTRDDNDQSQPWEHKKVGSEFRPFRVERRGTMGPADSIFCSMEDYLKFAKAHLDGFQGRDTAILPAVSFKKLHEQPPAQEYTYGGWIRTRPAWSGSQALFHPGWVRSCENGLLVGTFAVVWIAPDSDYAVIVVTNAGDTDYGSRVTDEVVRSVVDRFP